MIICESPVVALQAIPMHPKLISRNYSAISTSELGFVYQGYSIMRLNYWIRPHFWHPAHQIKVSDYQILERFTEFLTSF